MRAIKIQFRFVCLFTLLVVSMLATLEVAGQTVPDSTVDEFDYYILGFSADSEEVSLSAITREELGIFTEAELANMVAPQSMLLGELVTTGTHAGLVMVRQGQEIDPDEVIVIVTGFGPFPGVAVNPSSTVAKEVDKKLEELGIDSDLEIIDVNWGDP